MHKLPPTFENYGVQDWDEATYRAAPALAQSSMKLLLKDPALYDAQLRGEVPGHDSPSMQFGRETERFVFFDEQPAKPLKRKPFNPDGNTEPYRRILKHLTEHELAHKALFVGNVKYQVPIVFPDPFTGNIPIKSLLDVWNKPLDLVVDFKTANDISPSGFQRDAAKFGYFVQAAVYSKAVEYVTGREPEFIFVVARNQPPYDVALYEYDDVALAIGYEKFRKAVGAFIDHSTRGDWRRLGSEDVQVISVPKWVEYE